MRKIQISVTGNMLLIKEKNKAAMWELERKENWQEQAEEFFKEQDMLAGIELFLGEEYFKSRRIILESGESIKERVQEESQEDIDRRIWRWIRLEQRTAGSYLLISIAEVELFRMREFFHGKGHRILLVAPEFLKDRKINFIKVPNVRIYLILAVILLEIGVYGYLFYSGHEESRKLMGYRGTALELKERLETRVQELKEERTEEKKSEEREPSSIDTILQIIKEIPEGIYLESWEFQKGVLRLKGHGSQERLYELENHILGKRGVKWSEVEYMKRSERGYLFSLEISF